ncbi:MAG TPA: chromosomal replication initiator protein DnaA [Candidatus Acidoferrum sp.]|nr:chromosomal replication initiator protein DnaA [Candidatus Acidoferrum sp.]
MNSLEDIWGAAYARLTSMFTDVIVDTWLSGLTPVELRGDTLVIEAPSNFVKEIVEARYHSMIVECVEGVTGFRTYVSIRSNEDPTAPLLQAQAPAPATAPPDEPPGGYMAVEGYTFDNFIVGSSNKLAHAACIAVTDTPGDAFNPLFVYGGSGLGKTHLLFAVRNQMCRKDPNCRVVYVKGEDFVNEFVSSIGTATMSKFREKYRLLDVLLIDDVQFLAGKVQTQEEFFHTFNTLYEAKKQIVLTSDRPPKEIMPLEERLRTRFEWGLMADIQPPDYETRLAIINRKAASLNMVIPPEVSEFIADRLKKNIRQIEGAVKKLKAMHALEGYDINIDLARETIKDVLSDNMPIGVLIERIIAAVAEFYGLAPEDLLSAKRKADVLLARQAAIYLMRENTGISLKKIGEIFGGKDHATVINSVRRIEKELEVDPELKNALSEIMSNVRNP